MTVNPTLIQNIFPFLLLILSRIIGAQFSPIMDCDETYNYYEPLFLLYHSFTSNPPIYAFQTWEYAPQFALRSFAFLIPLATISFLLDTFCHNLVPTQLFFAIRFVISMTEFCSECFLVYSLFQFNRVYYGPKYASRFSFWFICILACSPGMFHSSPALLPSSFAMICTSVALAFWSRSELNNTTHVSVAVVCAFGLGSIAGWPFAGVLSLPYVLPRIIRTPFPTMKVGLIVSACIMLPMTLIDSYLYNRLSIVPFNLIQYNVVNNQSHLYGTEPMTYYLSNLILNWNVSLLLAILASVIYLAPNHLVSTCNDHVSRGCAYMIIGWISFMSMQLHKEERFMSPIYPALAIMAARGSILLIDTVPGRILQRGSRLVLGCLIFGVGILRIAALILYYGAPIHLQLSSFVHANLSGDPVTICTGDDWFLVPGHWHLPPYAHIKFVRQYFNGHLPGTFASSSIKGDSWLNNLRHATMSHNHTEFNNLNQLTESRYVDLSSCNYIIGRNNLGATNAKPVACLSMLMAEKTPSWSRVLYHPWKELGPQVWNEYCLWEHMAS